MSVIDAIRGRIADYKTDRIRREVPDMFAALEHEGHVHRIARLAEDVALRQSVLASCLTYAHRDVTGEFGGPNSDALAAALVDRLSAEGWQISRVASPRKDTD